MQTAYRLPPLLRNWRPVAVSTMTNSFKRVQQNDDHGYISLNKLVTGWQLTANRISSAPWSRHSWWQLCDVRFFLLVAMVCGSLHHHGQKGPLLIFRYGCVVLCCWLCSVSNYSLTGPPRHQYDQQRVCGLPEGQNHFSTHCASSANSSTVLKIHTFTCWPGGPSPRQLRQPFLCDEPHWLVKMLGGDYTTGLQYSHHLCWRFCGRVGGPLGCTSLHHHGQKGPLQHMMAADYVFVELGSRKEKFSVDRLKPCLSSEVTPAAPPCHGHPPLQSSESQPPFWGCPCRGRESGNQHREKSANLIVKS